jgi:predicted aldo/keto reductase-like oxidoreductase
LKKRRFGRTEHESTVAIFGAVALGEIQQKEADQAMELVIAAGVNHIDVAPSYGKAEERLGPWMETERDRFFLGCKTLERTGAKAQDELKRSLELLRTTFFDLYQFHAVVSMAELDQITCKGGALEAVLKAREEGLVKFIGITGHGLEIPTVLQEALRRFNFDSVLFPLNFILYGNHDYRKRAEALLVECEKRDIGSMVIKSIARGPWGEKQKTKNTWYQPFTEREWIKKSINFALSQAVTGICTAGDVSLLPDILEACENFKVLSSNEQEDLISRANEFEPLFA